MEAIMQQRDDGLCGEQPVRIHPKMQGTWTESFICWIVHFFIFKMRMSYSWMMEWLSR